MSALGAGETKTVIIWCTNCGGEIRRDVLPKMQVYTDEEHADPRDCIRHLNQQIEDLRERLP